MTEIDGNDRARLRAPGNLELSSSMIGQRGTGHFTSMLLGVAVVLFGCANNISKQIAAKPLNRFTSMLGVMTAITYVPLYGSILMILLRAGKVSRNEMKFIWSQVRGRMPIVAYFGVAALGDALGDIVGMICTPYVAGPLHSLLGNFTVAFVAVLSFILLKKRYSLWQILALLGVIGAVTVGLLPSFLHGSGETSSPFYAVVLAGSSLFNALSFVIKEVLFDRYQGYSLALESERPQGLHVFTVNTWESIFQLPLTLLSMPINQALNQTHGENAFSYLREAWACVASSLCGSKSVHPEYAGVLTAVYVATNILWNVSILLSVKHSGALVTFVALMAILPLSTLLFGFVTWPLLGRTPLNGLIWVSILLLIPSIVTFRIATEKQEERKRREPSFNVCCWPLLAAVPE